MTDNLYLQFQTMHQAIQEAFSKESVFSPERTDFLNALQGILEKCEIRKGGIVDVDYEDLFILYKNRHVVNDAAHIHEAFMGNTDMAQALRQVVLNIETAQKNLWQPQKAS